MVCPYTLAAASSLAGLGIPLQLNLKHLSKLEQPGAYSSTFQLNLTQSTPESPLDIS